MLFHSKAWHEAEPWMTACSLPGILQIFSCFLTLRSVIRMLNPADLNQARAGRLPGSVHLAIHWLHGDAWISANDLEANWRIQSLLNDLRDSGIALRSSFRPGGASVYAASLQQPGQSLWLCCGIIRMTSKDYERVKPLLAQHGQLLPEHRLVLPSQSILHIWRLASIKTYKNSLLPMHIWRLASINTVGHWIFCGQKGAWRKKNVCLFAQKNTKKHKNKALRK